LLNNGMNKIISYIAALCFCSITFSVNAQKKSAYFGEVTIGKVVKHREGLLFDVPPVSAIFQMGKVIQTDGAKSWHSYWGYPRLERSVHFNIFGDAEVLGYAIGAAPGVGFYMYRGERSAILLHLGAGFAYLNKEFNAVNNPMNNAIGSNFNNTTQVKISYERPIAQSLSIDVGLGITHYSNGLSSSPNSGINVIGFHLGIKPTMAIRNLSESIFDIETDEIERRWGMNGFVSFGVAEYSVPGGPKYPIKNYSLGVYYQSNPFLKWHVGLDYDYALGNYEFAIRDFQTEKTANAEATSTAAYAAIEGIFGDVSFRYQMGYYLDLLYDKTESVPYSKFNIIYNVPYNFYEVQPYVGILLKTHVAVAEYVAVQVGIEW